MTKDDIPGPGLRVSARKLFGFVSRVAVHFTAYLAVITLVLSASGCGGGTTTVQNNPISVTVSEGAKTVPAGGSMEVDASILNDSGGRGITWGVSCSAADCGSVSPASSVQATYTAPGAPTGAFAVTILATSVADTSKSASEVVNVAPIAITVTPQNATVAVGSTLSVSATVASDPANGGVTWSVSCSASGPCGSVSPSTTASGAPTTYTPPATLPLGDLGVTLLATAVSNGGVGASAAITVPGFTISVTPNPATVSTGKTAPFIATVTNDASKGGVVWSVTCDTPPCGSVSPTSTASGTPTTYTAPTAIPASDQGVTLTATSSTNSAVFGQAGIAIPGIDINVSVDNSTIDARTTAQVTGTVSSDTPNKGITWSVACDTAPCGTISPTTTNSGTPTTYTAPTNAPVADLGVTITATSAQEANATTSLAITVSAIGVSVAPVPVLLPQSAAQSFAATVTHDPSGSGVTWTLLDQNQAVCSPGCGTLAPTTTASGASTTVTAPVTVPASPTATLTATSVSDSTKSAGASITISSGTVKLVPSALNMGNVLLGQAGKPKVATVTNTAGSALNFTNISISGTNASSFTQTNNCGTSIAAGASCTITVTFKPKGVGTLIASATIADSSADSPQTIKLGGGGKQIRSNAAALAPLAGKGDTSVPAPTGTNTVGTRVIRLEDSGRVDPYLNNGTKRELLVRFWYPASVQQSCRVAEYTPRAVWTYFSQLSGIALPQVKTNSCSEAPATPGPHPVIVFSPGYTATFTDYTYLFEDLASRGYVVASVDHTYDATAVEFPDGRLVKSLMGSHLGGTVRGDDASLAFAALVRAADLRFVVGEIMRLNRQANSPFNGRMDLSRIGVMGHSMGGASAFLIAEHDPRIAATVMLDAAVPAGFAGRTGKATLMLRGREMWSADECHLWSSLRGPRAAITLADSDHVAPSDAVWLAPEGVATGALSVDEYIASVRDSAAKFFDLHLRGNTESRLTGDPFAQRAGLSITTDGEVPASCRQH